MQLILLAAGGDWISLLIPLIVTVIWVINQIVGKAGQGDRNRRRPPQQPTTPAQSPSQVDAEIQDFLRKASQNRQSPGSGTPSRPQQVPVARPAKPPAQKQQRPRPTSPVMAEVVEAEVVDLKPAPRKKRSQSQVASHVEKYLDTREFSQRSSHLTTVDQADEQMEGHLRQVFNHQIGSLAAEESAAAGLAPPSIGGENVPGTTQRRARAPINLAALLQNPQNMRQAIILQEILRPKGLDL